VRLPPKQQLQATHAGAATSKANSANIILGSLCQKRAAVLYASEPGKKGLLQHIFSLQSEELGAEALGRQKPARKDEPATEMEAQRAPLVDYKHLPSTNARRSSCAPAATNCPQETTICTKANIRNSTAARQL